MRFCATGTGSGSEWVWLSAPGLHAVDIRSELRRVRALAAIRPALDGYKFGPVLAKSFGLSPVFRCARMYYGPTPKVNIQHVFGVTSFEFG